MSELTAGELRERWRDRWDGFLDDIGAATTAEAARTALRDKRTIGNAERKIAGGHEGREILELLQNARDAIWNGDSEQGQVHITVYDEGVLVANTGSRFDLFDSQVEDAVTMIGETGKGDDDDQSIGHKGVGLKSILATGDAFDIYTRPESTSDDLLGVRLSRAYLVGALLRRLGHDVDIADRIDELDDPKLGTLLHERPETGTVSIDEGLATAISQLPLFNFPVPLRTDGGTSDRVGTRVRELLSRPEAGHDRPPYRTAVFVRYEDTDWRTLLSKYGISPPDEDEGSISDRPQRIWEYLSAAEGDGGLQPETLVQLGGIEKLHLERVTDSGGPTQTEEWEITREQSDHVGTDGLAHEEVEVRIGSSDSTEARHQFDQFRFETPRQYHTALLVNKSAAGNPLSETYPLYLFYPIESTSGSNLPFCLHGRFRVETNRKDLSSNKSDTNREVLAEGIDLIELVGREVATAEGDPDAPSYSMHLPWALLPPVPDDEIPEDPSSSDELSDWFRAELLERLADTECVPTDAGPTAPADTFLHWNEDVIRAYVAFTTILDELGRDRADTGSRRLPTMRSLEAAIATPTDWSNRFRRLLRVENGPEASKQLLSDWATHLDASLSMDPGGTPSQAVPASPARALLKGTVALLTESTAEGASVGSSLEELAPTFDGVYLLPCTIRGEDPDERLALVTLEQRVSPAGSRDSSGQVRSVIWDIESDTQDVERPPTLPRASNMTVYLLDETVQRDSDVHHVLSTAGRVWGIRAYEGIPSFVRSLLDTFADDRHDVVEQIDFAFLGAIIDRVGDDSRDLRTGEGEFFPLEYLRSAITQQEGDQRANLRRRVELRDCDLQIQKGSEQPISQTVIGDGWQTVRTRRRLDGDDEDPTEDWEPLSPELYPAPLLPEPDEFNWKSEEKRRTKEQNLARTLGLLGAASLPGIRIVWMYGDDHPSMRQQHNWNPTEWTRDDFDTEVPEQVRQLQAVLDDELEYLSQITSPDHHPQVSADHSPKCSVNTDGSLYQVNLASWIWLDNTERLAEHGEAVRELLRRHGDALDSTLLRTGWSCNNGHKRRDWERSIPSLLNWQLRTLDIWDPVVEVDDEMAGNWNGQTSRLRYAVRLESQRGPQAARMFPHVTGHSDLPDSLLDTLGVKPVEDLGMTGATERLQRLQSALVDGSLPEDAPARLWIPGERINDWNQAYTQLLQPILRQLPENPGSDDADPEWGDLTHLPLRDGDHWVAAPIDWITAHTDEVRYYQDQSPKPWETQAVEEAGYYILPRTAAGPFTRLSSALGVEQVEASKLVFDRDDDALEFVTEEYSDAISRFRSDLAERRDLLVASTERTDEDEVLSTADALSTAAADLAVVESFPDSALQQLSDPSSALYMTEAGDEALLLNAAESGDDLRREALSMGVALLFERPTKVATFREALSDTDVDVLETRWAKRTFPIGTVRRILGSNALQSIERDINTLVDLLERLERTPPDVEAGLAALDNADKEAITAVRERLAAGPPADDIDLSPLESEQESDPEALVAALLEESPDGLGFVASGLFGQSVTHWVREMETQGVDSDTEMVLIGWLADHRTALERPPFEEDARRAYSRFRTVAEFQEKTDSSELADIETWVDQLRKLHSTDLPEWTDTLPDSHTGTLACPPYVVHLCIENRVDTLVAELCEELSAAVPEVDFDWRSIVETYVSEGTLPEPESGAGAKSYQEQAFTDLAGSVRSEGADSENVSVAISSTDVQPAIAKSSITASEGGGQGGGSTQFRGRGQQAEAYVMAGILDRVSDWIQGPGTDLLHFRNRFRRIQREQQEADYKWHVQSAWESDLLPLLKNRDGLTDDSITDWRSLVSDGTSFADLPLIQLINVTMERGPGFDVIDPLGPVSTDHGRDDFGLWFTPVEVKAVNGSEGPFGFRLTTNEYRQARAFIRDGDIPYVVRLVSVPEPGTVDWPARTEIVAEKVLETESELDAIIGDYRFEDVVKGGYMNMQIE